MARLASVTPRHNPYRENPSGLVIGGVIVALAAAGGAGWYFFGRDPGFDKGLFDQLDQKRKDVILAITSKHRLGRNKSGEEVKKIRDEMMQTMLTRVRVGDEAYEKWVNDQLESTGSVKFSDYPGPIKYVSMQEADTLAAPDGKYEWMMSGMAMKDNFFNRLRLKEQYMPKRDEAKAREKGRAKEAAKKKGKKN